MPRRVGAKPRYSFRADIASPRTLILLDDTGERTIIAVDSGAGPSSFLPVRGPDLRSVDCVYVEGYTRYPTGTAAAAESALLVTSPPVPGATTWPATVVVGSETQYSDATSAGMFEAVRSVSGERLKWVVVTRGREGADAYAVSSELHVDAFVADQIDATGAGDAFTVGPEPVKLNETSGGWFYLTGLLGLDGGAGLVDPHLGGQGRGCRALAAEPVRAGGEGVV